MNTYQEDFKKSKTSNNDSEVELKIMIGNYIRVRILNLH